MCIRDRWEVITLILYAITLHKTLASKCSHPFHVQRRRLCPRLILEITASMPLRHFFNLVSMFLLLAMLRRLPTILLNTIFTIPFSLAYDWFANEAYPPSVA